MEGWSSEVVLSFARKQLFRLLDMIPQVVAWARLVDCWLGIQPFQWIAYHETLFYKTFFIFVRRRQSPLTREFRSVWNGSSKEYSHAECPSRILSHVKIVVRTRVEVPKLTMGASNGTQQREQEVSGATLRAAHFAL